MNIRLQAARVSRITRETDNVISIELNPAEGQTFAAFEPGAHIDVHLPNGLVRSYSLMSTSGASSHYRLGVLLDRHSRGGSAFIHRHLRVGLRFNVSIPRNNFPVTQASRAVLVAGGIGITPLLGMARQLADQGAAVDFLYCARSEREMAFRQELHALAGNITYHFDDVHGAAPDLLAYLGKYPAHTHAYCCGPAPMLAAFEHACKELGLEHCHVERFSGGLPTVQQGGGYEVVLARSGRQLFHAGHGSLIDTLVAAGQTVSYSCREGVCGACETVVLEGTPEHRDFVLSPAEQASGKTMMICVSGCKTPRLVLDL
ncbi:PDR/VanB family oxidoreductase [Pseudomonas sp. RIT-To-2]|uniref:PDR/VanB family oxidoreductase n=1 Tax=Pseudomonas sp. RIT-To-2 TaxID=3462541 RepID=UPI002413396F